MSLPHTKSEIHGERWYGVQRWAPTLSARDDCRIRTLIPPKHGRPADKPATDRYRRLMQTRFDHEKYSNRVQVETVMSMIKRRQGSHARGHKYWSQCRDLRLMALTHNIMILVIVQVFYRARMSPFIVLGRILYPSHASPKTDADDIRIVFDPSLLEAPEDLD